jgi:hypothetical protein
MQNRYPETKHTIIGSGIIAAMEAYHLFLTAKKAGERVRITILDRNTTLNHSTSSSIVPSLTPDEILSVVPRGLELMRNMQILFSEPGGIRVEDVEGVHGTVVTDQFTREALAYSQQDAEHTARTKTLLDLGKLSMDMWQAMYDNGDAELQTIMNDANFNPCREPRNEIPRLHDGYRIDLIYAVHNAEQRAIGMKEDYTRLGYQNCKILSPAEVMQRDAFLVDFCAAHSSKNDADELQWHNDTVALWRPGGCLDTQIFIPKFYAYLQQIMGQYEHIDGSLHDCFQIKLQRNVSTVNFAEKDQRLQVTGLNFFGNPQIIADTHEYKSRNYIFCPGEAVGTLRGFGFNEPSYAGFAGAVLKLVIPIPEDKLALYQTFNHCMEVHQEGVVLAWQARFHENNILIGVGGTKAFYGDRQPKIEHAFARNRNLLQLNMINNVLPEFISLALGKDTKGVQLTHDDLTVLQTKGIATRWVGTRAVAAEGFPTLGRLFRDFKPVMNARTTTHLGSGGVSFAPAAVAVSQDTEAKDELTETVLRYSHSCRRW